VSHQREPDGKGTGSQLRPADIEISVLQAHFVKGDFLL
jgi:hypothetical protein